MARSYLIDTNAVIDLLAGQLPEKSEKWLDKLLITEDTYLSVINRIELLGYNGNPGEMAVLKKFVDSMKILPLSSSVEEKSIEIRAHHKIKLPDAIIAATALVHSLVIVSRNLKDFQPIDGLEVIDPRNMP